MTQQLILILGAHVTEHGVTISHKTVDMLRDLGVDIRDKMLPFGGMPNADTILYDAEPMVGVHGTEYPAKLDAKQAAIVEAMVENLPARTNQSWFNDLAG